MRALIVVRLSRLTDASTSPERQLEKCRELCEQRGYEVVGIAEDLDVSASATTPFDRPQLGDWLANRFNEFDVLVFFRADRIVRRLFDLSDLIRWSREHSVTLVSATESYFDLSSECGDIIALLVAKVAELELAAISERSRSAAQHNMRAGKFRGGAPRGDICFVTRPASGACFRTPTRSRSSERLSSACWMASRFTLSRKILLSEVSRPRLTASQNTKALE